METNQNNDQDNKAQVIDDRATYDAMRIQSATPLTVYDKGGTRYVELDAQVPTDGA